MHYHLLDEMVSNARLLLPNEACGLLAGRSDESGLEIQKIYYLKNVDEAVDHFTMDPKEQLSAIKDMRASGLTPLGNWHSHPESPSRPSEEDIRLAYDPKAVYMILSFMGQNPVLNAFHIEGGEVRKEDLQIFSEEYNRW